METIDVWNTELFLFINGAHHNYLDSIMFYASDKLFWVPFYILLLLFIVKLYRQKSLKVFVSIAVLITFCDQTSNILKKSIKQLRPSHEPTLQNLVHLSLAGSGGKYGFVSAHAANAFGLAVFLSLILPEKYIWLKRGLLFWATLVSYSRIYNGVHYPSDVIFGVILGSVFAVLLYKLLVLLKLVSRRKVEYKVPHLAFE